MSQRPDPFIETIPRNPADRRATPDKSVTVIGNGARLEGNLISAASLRIEGVVNGTISAESDVTIAPEAEVAADIKATNATLGGRFKGNATVTGTIELTSTARVEGNLTSSSLIVNQGAVFTGQSIMDGGAHKEASSPAAKPAAVPTFSSTTLPSPSSGLSSSPGSGSSSSPGSGPAPGSGSSPSSSPGSGDGASTATSG